MNGDTLRVIALVTVALAFVLLVEGCQGTSRSRSPQEQQLIDIAQNLAPVGSVVDRMVSAHDASQLQAEVSIDYRSALSPTTILNHYDNELRKMGWAHCGKGGAWFWLQVHVYQKDHMVLRLAVSRFTGGFAVQLHWVIVNFCP